MFLGVIDFCSSKLWQRRASLCETKEGMGSEVEVMKEEVMFGNCILSSEVKNVSGPATPEENWEHNSNKQQQQDLSSPCPNANETFNSSSSLETPKETLFDSFAPPASNKFLLAPQHTKYRQEWRNHIVRRLDFTGDYLSSNVVDLVVDVEKSWCSSSPKEEEEGEEEQRLFEIVYFSIMDAKEAAPTTPKSAPLLDGIAHMCPAPPVKYSATKHKFIIDKEICKKLDF